MISLRLRLALSFGALTWVVLAASGTALYLGTSHALEQSFRREMVNTARVLQHRVDEDHEPINKELLDVGEHLSVRVLDESGAKVMESRGLSSKVAFDWHPPKDAPEGWCEDSSLAKGGYRLLATRMAKGWILVFGAMHSERAVLKQFRHGFYVVQALAPLLAGLLGYLALRRGLSPIRLLTEQARRIRPSNLAEPLVLSALPVELRALGAALNESMSSLAQAFTQLGQLNGDLAHELRTPLHALRLEMEGMLGVLPPGSPLEDRLVASMECVEHLRRVIGQMLHLAQAEDPSLALKLDNLEAESFLEQATMPFQAMAEDRRISLTQEAARAYSFTGDATLLRRALHNLLGNALRYTSEGGRVWIRIFPEGETTILEVGDDGPGMSPKDLARIGRRFLRLEDARERDKGGSGLGLAIVRGIAEQHGGRMDLLSQPAMGLRVRVVIPSACSLEAPQ